MPRTPAQNKVIKDKRREKLLKKSLKVFATRSYNEITVDDITNEANCAHGLFYHYFEGKAEAYDAIVLRMQGKKFISRLPKFEEAKKLGGFKGIQFLVREILAATKEDDEIVYFLLLCGYRHFVDDEGIKSPDLYLDLKKMVKDGQKEGKLREGTADEVALILVDVLNGMLRRRIIQGERFKAPKEETILSLIAK